MRTTALALLATLALTSSALAQNSMNMNMGSVTGTAGMSGLATAGGLSTSAGSIEAGANSAVNPSGNSFLNPPPGASGPSVGRLVR